MTLLIWNLLILQIFINYTAGAGHLYYGDDKGCVCVTTALTTQCTTGTCNRASNFHGMLYKKVLWEHMRQELTPDLRGGSWQQLASRKKRCLHCEVLLIWKMTRSYPCERGWRRGRAGECSLQNKWYMQGSGNKSEHNLRY